MPQSYQFDPEQIAAHLAHGVLDVHVPRAEAAKPRRIPVASS
jgi:HSP20 family molecular chaperone IbpA